MKTARTPDELDNPDFNYYFAFNIDPAEKDPTKIEAVMARQKNTFTQGTPVQRRLKDLYNEALAIMTDAASREQEYQAAKKFKLERAEKTVVSVVRGRAIYRSELKRMAEKSGKWFTADEIEKKITYLFEQGARLVDDTKGNLNFLTYTIIEKGLKVIGKRDLYDLLDSSQGASPAELLNAVTAAYNAVSGKSDHKSTAINQLCGEARKIFKDENSKKYYDIYLATKDIWDEFADRRDHGIAEMAHTGFMNFFERARKALNNDDVDYIEALLAEGLLYFRLTVAGKRSPGYSETEAAEAEAVIRTKVESELREKAEAESAAKAEAVAQSRARAKERAKRAAKARAAAQRRDFWQQMYYILFGGSRRKLIIFIINIIIFFVVVPFVFIPKECTSKSPVPPAPVTKTNDEPTSTDSRYLMAMALYTDDKYSEAAIFLKRLAEEGHAPSQYYYGHCLEYGTGVEKNVSQAIEWYIMSARQGFAAAQHELGLNYRDGKGVTQDVAQAAEWFRKAAAQGNDRAQNALGYAYENGEGVEKNNAQAAEWFRKAAEQGNASAQYNYANCFYEGKGVTRNFTSAVEWYRKAAEQGHISAQNNLGGCYANGQGVAQNFAKAAEWWRKSADKGNAWAQEALDKLKADGKI